MTDTEVKENKFGILGKISEFYLNLLCPTIKIQILSI